jgi:hypothetical protein
MTITLKQLRRMGACAPQVKLFKQTFGKSVELTRELVLAHASKFDLHWFACNYFKGKKLEAYQKARASAREAYQKAMASALEASREATAPARDTCQEAIASAEEDYEKARASAWEAYKKAIAIAFCDILESE